MKDWKYILYVVVAAGLFIGLKMISPKQYDWKVTYDPEDKNPFGAYVLNELMPSVFSGRVEHSFETFFELKDSLQKGGNIFVLCNHFRCGREDANALLRFVEEGGTAFISAEYFSGHLTDTLGFRVRDLFLERRNRNQHDSDSSYLQFVSRAFNTGNRYYFRQGNIQKHFVKHDLENGTVLVTNESGHAVAIKHQWGKGNFILNCTPLAFTNIYMLTADNHSFASNLLSYIPDADLQWTEYYQVGRLQSQSPLRFILRTESLRWAYYITVGALLVFMIFEMKRKQRIIPIIRPLANTSVEFVSTIGNLYYQSKDHQAVAAKKIMFLFEYIRMKLRVNTTASGDEFIRMVSRKSGKPEAEVRAMFGIVQHVRQKKSITQQELVELNEYIEKFYSPITNSSEL
jgi:hypothetical protein